MGLAGGEVGAGDGEGGSDIGPPVLPDGSDWVSDEGPAFWVFDVGVEGAGDGPANHVIGDADVVTVGEDRKRVADPNFVALAKRAELQQGSLGNLAKEIAFEHL